MKSVLTFILIYTLAVPAYSSDCIYPINHIKKDMPAFCTGWLYTDEANNQASLDHENVEYYKELSDRMEKRHELMVQQNKILDDRLQLYIKQSHVLSEELYKKEQRSQWEKIGWFVLGIGVTGLAVYGAGHLNN